MLRNPNQKAYMEIEYEDEYREWIDLIPAIKFKSEWGVKVIPPFGGAIARFLVFFNGKRASVYLDCYNRIGFFDGPYWEVFPVGDDVGRCAISDSDELLRLISESLE